MVNFVQFPLECLRCDFFSIRQTIFSFVHEVMHLFLMKRGELNPCDIGISYGSRLTFVDSDAANNNTSDEQDGEFLLKMNILDSA